MDLEVKSLSPALGAEIVGWSPDEISSDAAEAFLRCFEKHHLVLMRRLDLSESKHLELAEIIGPVSGADAIMKGEKKVTHISNVHSDGRLPAGELLYHADHIFLDTSLKAISLYALEVPEHGGETRFLNAAITYAALPDKIKERISTLWARHVYDYSPNRGDQRPVPGEISENSDTAVHPMVCRHPETGLPILLVSELFTVEVIGLPKSESDELLQALFDHINSFGDHYVHKWRVGDLVIWDNRILQHARNEFPASEKRALRRIPIGEGEPWEPAGVKHRASASAV